MQGTTSSIDYSYTRKSLRSANSHKWDHQAQGIEEEGCRANNFLNGAAQDN